MMKINFLTLSYVSRLLRRSAPAYQRWYLGIRHKHEKLCSSRRAAGCNLAVSSAQSLRRSGATEDARGDSIISDNVPQTVARQCRGAAGSGDKQPTAFVETEALLHGNTPIVTNSSLSRAPICGATNTFMEKGPY
jgi:hypothetical protein